MSIVATNIGSIPKSGFDWYITFIELEFEPKIQQEINSHFNEFGKSIGTKALAIRGYDQKNFRDSVFEASALYDEKLQQRINTTSLIVTNKNPEIAFSTESELDDGKILVFPLTETFKAHGSILPLLKDLTRSLLSGDAIDSLENLKIDKVTGKLSDENIFIKAWDWLCNYAEMKPGIFGFSLDFKMLVNTYIFKR